MDDEGRSETEQMVQQGVDEAAHEQMLDASKMNSPFKKSSGTDV
jgi:hypothetical protein